MPIAKIIETDNGALVAILADGSRVAVNPNPKHRDAKRGFPESIRINYPKETAIREAIRTFAKKVAKPDKNHFYHVTGRRVERDALGLVVTVFLNYDVYEVSRKQS